jgi:hypothetical protein
VTEFGSVAEVAPGYQEELALAQARRTSLLLLASVAAQPLVWDGLRPLVASAPPGATVPVQQVLSDVAQWVGAVTIMTAAIAVVACGAGTRVAGVGQRATRISGILAIVAAIVGATVACVMLLVGSSAAPTAAVAGLPWLVGAVAVPMALVVSLGPSLPEPGLNDVRRCQPPAPVRVPDESRWSADASRSVRLPGGGVRRG